VPNTASIECAWCVVWRVGCPGGVCS